MALHICAGPHILVFPFNLPSLALSPPRDTKGQTRLVLQLTEKRTSRSIPMLAPEKYLLYLRGLEQLSPRAH